MAKPSRNMMLIIALICGLGATVLIYRLVHSTSAQKAQQGTASVVVANSNLAKGVELTLGHLKIETRQRADLPEGIYSQPGQVVGRMVKERIREGEPIVDKALSPADESPVLGVVIPPGYRAMGVFVDARGGIQHFLRPGDHVDVVVTVLEKERERKMFSSSQMVLQDVTVLAVPPAAELKKEKKKDSIPIVPVTLAVTPHQSEKLSLGMEIGVLQLVVRGYNEKQLASTSGVTWDTLLPGSPSSHSMILKPEEATVSYQVVELIRGGDRRQQRFGGNGARWLNMPNADGFTSDSVGSEAASAGNTETTRGSRQ